MIPFIFVYCISDLSNHLIIPPHALPLWAVHEAFKLVWYFSCSCLITQNIFFNCHSFVICQSYLLMNCHSFWLVVVVKISFHWELLTWLERTMGCILCPRKSSSTQRSTSKPITWKHFHTYHIWVSAICHSSKHTKNVVT